MSTQQHAVLSSSGIGQVHIERETLVSGEPNAYVITATAYLAGENNSDLTYVWSHPLDEQHQAWAFARQLAAACDSHNQLALLVAMKNA